MEDAPDGLRRSRWWAIAAFLLLLTSVWLPWWLVRYESQGVRYDASAAGLFAPVVPVSNEAGPFATGILVVAILLWLFVRVAGRSWLYEAPAWRRDMAIISGATVLALGSAFAWPDEVPAFWRSHEYALANATGTFTEEALPGLGWWSALVAAVCLAVAWWSSRPTDEEA